MKNPLISAWCALRLINGSISISCALNQSENSAHDCGHGMQKGRSLVSPPLWSCPRLAWPLSDSTLASLMPSSVMADVTIFDQELQNGSDSSLWFRCKSSGKEVVPPDTFGAILRAGNGLLGEWPRFLRGFLPPRKSNSGQVGSQQICSTRGLATQRTQNALIDLIGFVEVLARSISSSIKSTCQSPF